MPRCPECKRERDWNTCDTCGTRFPGDRCPYQSWHNDRKAAQ